jgi:hypothetical protein
MTLYAGGLVVLTGYNASQDGVEIGNPTGDMDITLSGGANQRILYLEGSSGNVGIGTTTLNRSGLGIDHKVLTVGRDTEMGMLELQGTRTSDADLGRIAWLNAGTRLSEIVVSRIDNNTSTKMSFRTSDTGSLSTKMTILPNGNVGIGTIGPGAKLTVDGVGYSFIAGYDSGNRRVHIGLDSIGEPSIQGTLSNGTARQISINPNGGNVGIGTVSPAAPFVTRMAANKNIMFRSSNGESEIFAATDNGAAYAPLWINSSKTCFTVGNVGIGTTSPDLKLDVESTNSSAFSGTGYRTALFQSTSAVNADKPGITLGYDTTGGGIIAPATQNGTTNFLGFWTYNSGWGERVRIAKDGNVGIGTITPRSALDVTGTTGLTWNAATLDSSGLVTIGTRGTGGSLFINTPSINTDWSAGLGVDGSYSSNISTVNIKAFGPKLASGALQGSNLTFSTTYETTLSERMRIDRNGNVGIGTDSPDSKLDVTGGDITVNTSGTGFMNFKYGAVGSETARGSITTDGIDLKVNATADLLLLPTGNVGIGTTNPSRRLTVMTSPQAAMTAGTASGHFFLTNTGGSSGLYGLYGGVTSDGDGWFQSARNDSATYYNLLLQANGGNVGIGTVSPSYKLQVDGDIVNFQQGDTYADGLQFLRTGATRANIWLNGVNNTLNITRGLGTVGMAINYNGNVGIGTTSPSAQLHLQNGSTEDVSGSTIRMDLSGINPYWEVQARNGGTSATRQLGFYTSATSGDVLTLTQAGNVGIGTTTS